jgi:cytoskeletal protein CcmA (bactofilin family)
MEDTSPDNNDDINSLETPESPAASAAGSGAPGDSDGKPAPKKKSLGKRMQGIIGRINIYLLLFILIVVLSAGIVMVGIQRGQREAAIPEIETTPLTPEALERLRGSEAKVGDPKQTLSIESNTIFTGNVLVQNSLEVAGQLKIGGTLNLPGITVAGISSFDQLAANRATIAGDTTIQGQLNVQQALTIAGGASFGGNVSAPQITVNNLQLTGDLVISRHIDAAGPTPGVSRGGAVGGGGTVSLSGTDTAGTITINTGGGTSSGCMATVSFARRFNGTPHVVVTPVGPGGAGLNYYVTRNTASFTLCTTNAPPGGSSFGFDYIVID